MLAFTTWQVTRKAEALCKTKLAHTSHAQSQTTWDVVRPVQAVTEDTFIHTVTRATAQCELSLTVPNRNILT